MKILQCCRKVGGMMKNPRDGRVCGPKGQDSASTLLSWKKSLFLLAVPSQSPQWPLFQSPACQDYHREKTPANAPASIWGGKGANPAEQTTAQGFAFVFMALNGAVSLLGSGWMQGKCAVHVKSNLGPFGVELGLKPEGSEPKFLFTLMKQHWAHTNTKNSH